MSNSGSRGLSDLSLRDLCQALAARQPTPSGGSLAAAVGALGAAGASMTLRYAEGEWRPWQEGRAAELEALALRLCDLVERDSAVYDKVVAAKAAGGAQALEKALREALETPLEMMEASLGGLRLTAAGAPQGLPAYLRCDCLAAARALATALEAAHLMIRENAGGVTRDAELEHLLAAADAVAAEARGLVQGLAGVLRLEPA